MYKKRIFLLGALFILLGAINVSADTIPGGDVSGTWYQANSPYYITGNITIPTDSSLLIEPGVEVNFQGHYYLRVNGLLQAIGIETDSILFTAADTSAGWGGIRLENSPDSSKLRYCTIQYGRATGGGNYNYGGGIYCVSPTASITHCLITNNRATEDGGGIYIGIGGGYDSPHISDCRILGNSASNGGGIYFEALTVNISDCIIKHNLASSPSGDSKGGGIWCSGYFGGGISISGCTIDSNTCLSDDDLNYDGGFGGGIYCYRQNTQGVTISECKLRGNYAFNRGGGIYTDRLKKINISDCTVTENIVEYTLDSILYVGAGIHLIDCDSVIISHCLVKKNNGGVAGYSVGGICCVGGVLKVENCTIAGNQGSLTGAIKAYPNLSVVNTIIAGNSSLYYPFGGIHCYGSSSVSITYSDFYDNDSLNCYTAPGGFEVLSQINANGDSSDQYNNIFLEPVFVDTSVGDYNLQANSPCVDAGDPSSPRDPDSSISDIGAFYYHYLRGDANSDGNVSLSDIVYLISYLFKFGSAPAPIQSGDANCDGKVSLSDIVYLIAYLFKQGPPPGC